MTEACQTLLDSEEAEDDPLATAFSVAADQLVTVLMEFFEAGQHRSRPLSSNGLLSRVCRRTIHHLQETKEAIAEMSACIKQNSDSRQDWNLTPPSNSDCCISPYEEYEDAGFKDTSLPEPSNQDKSPVQDAGEKADDSSGYINIVIGNVTGSSEDVTKNTKESLESVQDIFEVPPDDVGISEKHGVTAVDESEGQVVRVRGVSPDRALDMLSPYSDDPDLPWSQQRTHPDRHRLSLSARKKMSTQLSPGLAPSTQPCSSSSSSHEKDLPSVMAGGSLGFDCSSSTTHRLDICETKNERKITENNTSKKTKEKRPGVSFTTKRQIRFSDSDSDFSDDYVQASQKQKRAKQSKKDPYDGSSRKNRIESTVSRIEDIPETYDCEGEVSEKSQTPSEHKVKEKGAATDFGRKRSRTVSSSSLSFKSKKQKSSNDRGPCETDMHPPASYRKKVKETKSRASSSSTKTPASVKEMPPGKRSSRVTSASSSDIEIIDLARSTPYFTQKSNSEESLDMVDLGNNDNIRGLGKKSGHEKGRIRGLPSYRSAVAKAKSCAKWVQNMPSQTEEVLVSEDLSSDEELPSFLNRPSATLSSETHDSDATVDEVLHCSHQTSGRTRVRGAPSSNHRISLGGNFDLLSDDTIHDARGDSSDASSTSSLLL